MSRDCSPPPLVVEYRRLGPGDDLGALTDLLHRAYAPLAARGMRFVASWQSVEITERRISRGECWAGETAEHPGRIVATVTLAAPGRATGPEAPRFYARPDVASFGQFAVEPELQGRGVGARLLGRIEQRARDLGARWLALDTSEHALELHAWYERRGYRTIGRHDWRPHVNYESVIRAKRIGEARRPTPGG